MVEVAGFDKGVEVAEALFGPELARPLEPTLLLGASRFDWTASDRPASPGQFLIIHPLPMAMKVILFPADGFPCFSTPLTYLTEALENFSLLAVAQVMALLVHPTVPH